MKRSKKPFLIFLGAIGLVVAAGILCIILQAAPTVNHALRIAEMLRPLLDAPNQTMHLAVNAEVDGKSFALESDVYFVTAEETAFLAVEQNGASVYVADHVLFLENGKAFRLGDKVERQLSSYQALLPIISELYEVLEIVAEETAQKTTYAVTVTGAQSERLLNFLSQGEPFPTEGIEKLRLCLTEANGQLECITFSGSGRVDATAVALHVTLSGFRILGAGDFHIPEQVLQSAATVDEDALFCLSEDLYRLAWAMAPLVNGEAGNGILELVVDCGVIQLDTQLRLSELGTSIGNRLVPENLQILPEVLGFLCMEGDICCTRIDGNDQYSLKLHQQAMQDLAELILPELKQYRGNLTEGSVTIVLDGNRMVSMNLSMEGKISAMVIQIPIAVNATISFPSGGLGG